MFVFLSSTAYAMMNEYGVISKTFQVDLNAYGVFYRSVFHDDNDADLSEDAEGSLYPGNSVSCVIDWERRFDHMQQHSGEHIVSGMICEMFSCNNVGFHLGEDCVTIDFDARISLPKISVLSCFFKISFHKIILCIVFRVFEDIFKHIMQNDTHILSRRYSRRYQILSGDGEIF